MNSKQWQYVGIAVGMGAVGAHAGSPTSSQPSQGSTGSWQPLSTTALPIQSPMGAQPTSWVPTSSPIIATPVITSTGTPVTQTSTVPTGPVQNITTTPLSGVPGVVSTPFTNAVTIVTTPAPPVGGPVYQQGITQFAVLPSGVGSNPSPIVSAPLVINPATNAIIPSSSFTTAPQARVLV